LNAPPLRRRQAQLEAIAEALADQRLMLDALMGEARRAAAATSPADAAARAVWAEKAAQLAERERWLEERMAEVQGERRRLAEQRAQKKTPAGPPVRTGGPAGGDTSFFDAA
jgi:ribosomal protein L12E/L44/L45/RPP1/RPP2